MAGELSVCRFAAVRTLNKVAMTHPMAVTNCNIDMESLISDQNRSIATLAITTLLKTGNESSVDRLLKQVCPAMPQCSGSPTDKRRQHKHRHHSTHHLL